MSTSHLLLPTILIWLSLFAGCGSSRASSQQEVEFVHQSPSVIDAGVVFSNQANYLCFPFSQFNLPDERVEEIHSSCECVKGSEVEYLQVDKAVGKALRLDFKESKTETPSANLQVELTIVFSNNTKRVITVQFLSCPNFHSKFSKPGE